MVGSAPGDRMKMRGLQQLESFVGLGQVEGRRLHELLTQLLHHEIRHGLDNL